jgi:hypothetical protein
LNIYAPIGVVGGLGLLAATDHLVIILDYDDAEIHIAG